jgi:NAD(P)H-flavin reductase
MAQLSSLKGWRIFLCGHPDMVNQSKRQAYLQGANLQDIHADAFHVASSTLD